SGHGSAGASLDQAVRAVGCDVGPYLGRTTGPDDPNRVSTIVRSDAESSDRLRGGQVAMPRADVALLHIGTRIKLDACAQRRRTRCMQRLNAHRSTSTRVVAPEHQRPSILRRDEIQVAVSVKIAHGGTPQYSGIPKGTGDRHDDVA